MQVSGKGLAFIAGHEGFVSRGYCCPAGVITIGYGFTMRSRIFAAWWRKHHGRDLRVNDRMSRADCDAVLAKMLAEEYAAAVRKRFSNLTQAQFDACVSVTYNVGPRVLGWKWAKALARGDVKGGASLLRKTAVTAGGRRLKGLVRRRAEEAKLLSGGIYAGVREGDHRAATSLRPRNPDPVIKEAQEALSRFGFDPGKIDGWLGRDTKAAVIAYQKSHPHLQNDGVLGPATLAQLRRDALAVKDTLAGGGGVAGAGILSAVGGLPWGWIVAGGLCLGGLYLVIRYRDVIQRRFNAALRREVA